MPAQAALEHVRRLVQEAAATTAREHVKAHAVELAADVLALALALAPPHAQEAAATIVPVVVATLALAHAQPLPPPLAHHVATIALVVVVVAALPLAAGPLEAAVAVEVRIVKPVLHPVTHIALQHVE